jgi:hypothetical protein
MLIVHEIKLKFNVNALSYGIFMTVFVKYLKEFNDGHIADVLVIPIDIRLMAHNASSEAIIEAAGSALKVEYAKREIAVNTSFLTEGFELEKSKGIKFLVHSVIALDKTDEVELKKCLNLYYQNSLESAIAERITSITLPVIASLNQINIENKVAVKAATNPVLQFIKEYPDIKINLICGDETLFCCFSIDNDNNGFSIVENSKEEMPKPNPVKPTEDELLTERKKANPGLNDIPDSLLHWHNISGNSLKKAVKDEKLEKVECYLGPNLSSIRARYDNGKTADLQWRHYKYVRKAKLFQRALDGMDHHKEYWGYHAKLIFRYSSLIRHYYDNYSGYQMMDAFLDSACSLEKFTEWKNKKIHKEWINAEYKSYSDFLKYVREHFKWLQGSEHGQSKFAKSLIGYIFSRVFLESEFTNKIDENLLQLFKNQLTRIISENIADWENLKVVLRKFLAETNEAIKVIEAEADLSYARLIDEQKKVITDYIPSVVGVFKKDDSAETVETINKALINVINYNNMGFSAARGDDVINECFKLSKDSKNEPVTRMLNERYLNESNRKLVLAVQEINEAQVIDFDQHDILKVPMDWSELSSFLLKVTCTSELQHVLNMKLQEYISIRASSSIYHYFIESFYTTESLLKGKQFVSYLIGCLFLARANELDRGILFDDQTDKSIGIHRIIKELSLLKVESSYLKLMLNEILTGITSNNYLFLGRIVETKKADQQSMITAEATLFYNGLKNKPLNLPTSKQHSPQYESLVSLGLFGCGNYPAKQSTLKLNHKLTRF